MASGAGGKRHVKAERGKLEQAACPGGLAHAWGVDPGPAACKAGVLTTALWSHPAFFFLTSLHAANVFLREKYFTCEVFIPLGAGDPAVNKTDNSLVLVGFLFRLWWSLSTQTLCF